MSEVALPVPDLEGRPVTYYEYVAFTPEKLELIEGYLIDAPGRSRRRVQLLALLLVNEGLLEAVTLAPPERWMEALRRVYGPGGVREQSDHLPA